MSSAIYVLLIACLFAIPAKLDLKVTPLENPAGPGSIQPNLTRARGDALILSWLQPVSNGSSKLALRYSTFRNEKWSQVLTVVESESFKTHPSVPPAVTELSDNDVIAYWGQGRHSAGTGAHAHVEDVCVSISRDRGRTWSAPIIPHSDRSDVEHSFASLVPVGPGSAEIVWLDGRTPGKQRLMAALINVNGTVGKERLLDDDVCTCCPTATAMTSHGPIAAFRDHESGDVRDISIVRMKEGVWTSPKTLCRDGWKIAGCPINGVDLAANGDLVAAAWYTGVTDDPQVRVAFSENAGETFGAPVAINSKRAVGRTSIAVLPSREAVALWVEGIADKDESKSSTVIFVRRIAAGNQLGDPLNITSTARGIGFPRIEACSRGAVIAWTDKSQAKSVVTALATPAPVE